MREWLVFVTGKAVLGLDALALLFIVVGTVEAVLKGLRVMLTSAAGHVRGGVWLRYERWLVAGLTLQLAADIIETSITTSWDALGRLGAVAVIRTFLNYFLERDLAEIRNGRQEASRP